MKTNQSRKRQNPTLPKPDCVVKVGDGRGFIFEYRTAAPSLDRQRRRMAKFISRRAILTTAHCLPTFPRLPPAHAMAFYWQRTYEDLLGAIHGTKQDLSAECLFVNPVADIAVLGSPDQQEMYDQARAFDDLINEVPAVRLAKPRNGRAWVLSTEGDWAATPMEVITGLYGTELLIGATKAGMSGSPILNDAGRAVGLVAIGTNVNGNPEEKGMQPSQPIPYLELPRRFLV